MGEWAKSGNAARTHGRTNTGEHNSWQLMLARCYCPTHHKYRLYGARGITVCARWRESFVNFFADMGPRPEGTTLDRYPDNDGNYEPGNCRWATAREQGRNRRTNRIVEVDGEKMTLIDAVEKKGANYDRVNKRLQIGWSVERALGK